MGSRDNEDSSIIAINWEKNKRKGVRQLEGERIMRKREQTYKLESIRERKGSTTMGQSLFEACSGAT